MPIGASSKALRKRSSAVRSACSASRRLVTSWAVPVIRTGVPEPSSKVTGRSPR